MKVDIRDALTFFAFLVSVMMAGILLGWGVILSLLFDGGAMISVSASFLFLLYGLLLTFQTLALFSKDFRARWLK
ncbi:MAG: hypothetical protein MUO84_07100 [Thermoplasmata archaeon]|nr:hypothetical protein [Thermoplasmata archaeon]